LDDQVVVAYVIMWAGRVVEVINMPKLGIDMVDLLAMDGNGNGNSIILSSMSNVNNKLDYTQRLLLETRPVPYS
jgi:hypothetical protein